MRNECIFCDFEKERAEGNILFDSENFYVEPAMRGAFAAGHVLLIPKFHISCFGDMPEKYDGEFTRLFRKTRAKIERVFSRPLCAEMGVHGQSIGHAHMHIFPSSSGHYEIKSLVEGVPEAIKRDGIRHLDALRILYRDEGQYVLFLENEKFHVCHTQGHKEGSVRLRDIFAKVTGLSDLSRWQTMSPENKKRNEDWICETEEKLGEKK
jgi:diadenosine tetraphosphate (Ap4A) HIT family hydrolase